MILTVVLLLCMTVRSQWEWSTQIGGPGPDGAYIGAVDGQGAAHVFGSYANSMGPNTFNDCYFATDTLFGSDDAFLAKFTSDGTLDWARSVASSGDAHIGSMILDSGGACLYLTGSYELNCTLDTCALSTLGAGVFLAKWTLDGSCLWARTIATSSYSQLGSASGLALAQDVNGDLFVSMKTAPIGTTMAGSQPMEPGALLGKYDPDGNEIWVKSFSSFIGSNKYVYLYTLRYHDGHLYGHGPAATGLMPDTTTVDTIQIIGRLGQGYALTSIDPSTGIAEWFRMDGFPNGPSSTQSMDIDPTGNIFCSGSFASSAVFDEDTLSSTTAYAKGYLTKYTAAGNLVFTRSFEGSNSFGFLGIDVTPNGTLALTGSMRGAIELNGSTYAATTTRDMFVSLHDGDGDPIGLIHAGVGTGFSVRIHDDEIFVCGQFPGGDIPVDPITIGNDSYESHGVEDIFLAKHDQITSTPQPMVLEDDGLHIYANPNRGSFRLRLPSALENEPELLLRIYNSSGQLVREQQLDMTEERPRMDVWDVGPGLYSVTVTNGRRTYSGSMVVE